MVPVIPFSAGEDKVRDVTVERHVGGRVYERWADGTEHAWGELLVYQPPERFAMTWRVVLGAHRGRSDVRRPRPGTDKGVPCAQRLGEAVRR